MRKIAVFVGLFLIFSFALAQKAEATCEPAGLTCGPSKPVLCVGDGLHRAQCCDTGDFCPTGTKPQGMTQTYELCDVVQDVNKREDCRSCMGTVGSTWTAIGCIKTDPNDFLGKILSLGIGIAGGIAFLLILFGGLQIMTSAGNPEQLSAGQELISSAIAGLLLIIFSIFLLKFIGINIIGIPGWNP